MNRLPQRKKRGDPILAEDWNALLDAIASRTPRPGTGLELIASSGGFAYSRPGPGLSPNPGLPPFAVIGIEKKDEAYLLESLTEPNAKLAEGYDQIPVSSMPPMGQILTPQELADVLAFLKGLTK
jgi:hypothetical protein